MGVNELLNGILEAEAEKLRREIKEKAREKEFARRNSILASQIDRLKKELGHTQ